MSKIRLVCFTLFFVVIGCYSIAQPKKLGKVSSSAITEISGITPYSYQDGYFWVHNDSGDKAQIYLIDSMANLISTVSLDGIKVIDCEDIARVVVNGASYLLLADIGNNVKNREILSLYMIPEPKVNFDKKNMSIDEKAIKKINIKYEDKRRDAEAIFVDQQRQEIYIVSKRDFRSLVFSFPIRQIGKTDVISLRPKLELPFTFVTAGDMSLDGKYILLKNLTSIFMWELKEGEDVIQTLSRPYQYIPYIIEPQGEAICFDKNERYFYTISERPLGLDAYLYKYIY